ncbi:hypothetical protein ACLB2K_044231 [Fragaria x ananassa]
MMSFKCPNSIIDLNSFRFFMDMGSASRVMPSNYQRPTSRLYLKYSRGALSSFSRGIYALSVDAFEDINSGLWGTHLPKSDATSAKVMKFDNIRSSTNIYAMIYYRILIQVKWLLKLSKIPEITEVPSFSERAQRYLQGVIDGFCIMEAIEMTTRCEKKTNHDYVRAVEFFLKLRCISIPEITKVLDTFQFASTSEDIDSLAHALMLKDVMNNVVFPVMDDLIKAISTLSKDNASIPILSRREGYKVSPTTLGKELANFAVRLSIERHRASEVKIMGKFPGAVGSSNAHYVIYPHINWPHIAEEFVTSLGVTFNPYATEAETYDYMPKIFNAINRFNSIVIDFEKDMSDHMYFGYLKSRGFDLSEATLGAARQALSYVTSLLPKSRFSDELTDSSILRNMSEGLVCSVIAYEWIFTNIAKIQIDEALANDEMNHSPAVLAEAVQAVIRRYGVPAETYEKLKELTMGRRVTKKSLRKIIEGLELPKDHQTILSRLTPRSYVGEDVKFAKMVDMGVKAATSNINKSATAWPQLDGLCWDKFKDLAPYTSEYGLIYFIVLVQIKWLLLLSEIPEVTEVPRFSKSAQSYLQQIIDGFTINDAFEVKNLVKVAKVDEVAAVDQFIKKRCGSHPEIAKVVEVFHFACTSEEVNNLAQALVLKGTMDKVIYPAMDDLIYAICGIAKDTAHIPIVSSTHDGQPVAFTTLGKEMANFAVKLSRERKEISQLQLKGNLGGEVGNYNAYLVAYPDINWPQVAEEFVTSLGLSFNPYVTRIRAYDYVTELVHGVGQFNKILTDFDGEVQRYMNMGCFKQINKASEGSNIGVASGNQCSLSRKLPISTLLRNMGSRLEHSLVTYKNTLDLISTLEAVDAGTIKEYLNLYSGALVGELETVVQRYGVPEPYEKLKEQTGGEVIVTKESIVHFIQGMEVPDEAKVILLNLTQCSYVGAASELARTVDIAVNS